MAFARYPKSSTHSSKAKRKGNDLGGPETLSEFSVFCRWKINLPSSISTGTDGRTDVQCMKFWSVKHLSAPPPAKSDPTTLVVVPFYLSFRTECADAQGDYLQVWTD